MLFRSITNQRAGRVSSLGLRTSMTNGMPLVLDVAADSPAARAGIAAGDLITGIGTQRILRMSLPDAQQLLAPAAGAVTLRVVSATATNTLELTPAPWPQPAIETAELFPNQIGYIKLNGLYTGSGRDIISRIRGWAESSCQGVVLDLRGAGGDDLDAVAQTASLFTTPGQFLFAYRDYHQQDLESRRAAGGGSIDLPVMVLIDRHTSDAAEVLAAALAGASRSILVMGEPSAGNFLLRERVPLRDAYLLIATRVLDTADGRRYSGQSGLAPTLAVEGRQRDTHDYEPPDDLLDRRTQLDIEERDRALRRRVRGDGTLERAIDILIGLKTLNKGSGQVFSPPSS